MTTSVTFAAALRALEIRGVRLDAGPRVRGPVFAYGGADGELRDEAWAMCPSCDYYGLRLERRDDGRALVSCRQGCSPAVILEALAVAVITEAAWAS